MTSQLSSLEEKDRASVSQDWLVTGEGSCIALSLEELELPESPYRLYRFLTEMEDILASVPDMSGRIRAIAPLVRKLLISSDWLQMEFTYPAADPGWSVRFLYREPNYPITIQMVAWLPGNQSPIHNHATWGLVALISGQEKNRLWKRSPTPDNPDRIECVGEQILNPGDIIGFLPEAIHSVEPLGDEPAITFNLYGITDFSQRLEFDPVHHTAKTF